MFLSGIKCEKNFFPGGIGKKEEKGKGALFRSGVRGERMGAENFHSMFDLFRCGRRRVRHGVCDAAGCVFGPCQSVIRKELYAFDAAESAEKGAGPFHILVRVVAAGNERNPDLDFGSMFGEKAQIVQNRFIALAGEFPVLGGIGVFEVDKEETG